MCMSVRKFTCCYVCAVSGVRQEVIEAVFVSLDVHVTVADRYHGDASTVTVRCSVPYARRGGVCTKYAFD